MPLSFDRRRLLLAGGVAGVAALGGAFWALRRQRAEPPALPSELWQMRFPAPGGGEVALAAFRSKPLVLNFWATWCAPCIKELPQFDRFHKEFAARGWQVVGLAIDDAEAVRTFLARAPVSFPIGLVGTDLMVSLGNSDGVLPFTVVLAANGDVVQRRRGETSYDELVTWASG